MTEKMPSSLKLKAGDLKPGDPVIVKRSPNGTRGRPHSEWFVPAQIVKVGRVWVEIEATGEGPTWPRTWRMRIDTQAEGSQSSSYSASFRTPEQHAWRERVYEADEFLKSQGISVDRDSSWKPEARRVTLADLLREVS